MQFSQWQEQVPVKSTQLHCLRRGRQVKDAARTVAAPPAALAPQVSEQRPEKPSAEQQKPGSRPTIKILAREKSEQPKAHLTAGVMPRATVSPRKVASPKIIAFGRSLSNPVNIPDFRRYISNSNASDFKVTNTAYKPTMSTIFSYDLSPLERNVYGLSEKTPINPMKLVPLKEVQLLKSGQRTTYLERRYERTPDAKYNYPEATSMRYGWFHNLGDPLQKRVARKD